MTCKHRWEPSNFGYEHRTRLYLYQCRRCGHIISAMLNTGESK